MKLIGVFFGTAALLLLALGAYGLIAGPKTPVVGDTTIAAKFEPKKDGIVTAEAGNAYVVYAQKVNQKPQNLQVLTQYNDNMGGLFAYMTSNFAYGLGVSCQYCHNLNNFASDENPNKVQARNMLRMTNDINANLITWQNHREVQCVTCHYGKPNNLAYYPPAEPASTGARLNYANPGYPGLGLNYAPQGQNGSPVESVNNTLGVMYLMGKSLGVACNFCHNSNNFPSYEIVQKTYAKTMLLMASSLNSRWLADLPNNEQGTKGATCYLCHKGYKIPPGAGPTPPNPTIADPARAREQGSGPGTLDG